METQVLGSFYLSSDCSGPHMTSEPVCNYKLGATGLDPLDWKGPNHYMRGGNNHELMWGLVYNGLCSFAFTIKCLSSYIKTLV